MRMRPDRRSFLKMGTAAASVAAGRLAGAASGSHSVAIVLDPSVGAAGFAPVQWAADRLRAALKLRGITQDNTSPGMRVVVATSGSATGAALGGGKVTGAEAVALFPASYEGSPAILVTGTDARGVGYGLLELADRVRYSEDRLLALHLSAPVVETSPNRIRSAARAFLSEVEDKPWFYDRAFWGSYLDTLAHARFNRFNFALGFGYDFPRGVTGDYFHFPYPYLVELAAYPDVRIDPPLAPGERQRNLETLQFMAAETARRGMEFQLGIWTNAYQWTDSPKSDHRILGLTPETHAAYCRDALAAILAACPQITGLTLRVHGESGIPEGSYSFWQTLFEAVPAARTPEGQPRKIELDLHAKGLDARTIELARATGMPVKAGAKFWAEHQGLGYQQADIRATEYPREGVTGTFAVSNGARNFTRYGYADFYKEGFGLEVLYRVWPGTQHHLLWADPALAAGYGRAAHFCGAVGMELCEPLTFKGREGSGHPGGRLAYVDRALAPAREGLGDMDTDKFDLTYLLWGRYLFNPETAPEVQGRYLRAVYGASGPALGEALAAASRILPLITTVWLPSASNHTFWPEMFTPISILPVTGRTIYTDSPAPHNVSAISPLDPQLFTTIEQHAANLVSGTVDARYNTSDILGWLEGMVRAANSSLVLARKTAGAKGSATPEFRRAEEDVLILCGLGTYFAETFRAGLFYSVEDGPQCVAALRRGRDAWAAMANRARGVYVADVSYGAPAHRRGHWIDRLPAIDADLAAVQAHFAAAPPRTGAQAPAKLPAAARPSVAATHAPPESFHPGGELALRVEAPGVSEAVLWYRHVTQAERWVSMPMQHGAAGFTAAIPGSYSDSPYPLQYYFELRTARTAVLHPPFNATLSNQPYYAVYKRS